MVKAYTQMEYNILINFLHLFWIAEYSLKNDHFMVKKSDITEMHYNDCTEMEYLNCIVFPAFFILWLCVIIHSADIPEHLCVLPCLV